MKKANLQIGSILLGFTILLTGCTNVRFNPQLTFEENITQTVFNAQRNFNGSVLISMGNEILYRKNFGYSNYEDSQFIQNDHRFTIASVTKQFTASCIMVLSQENLLDTTDYLSKYIPEIRFSDQVTIHQLLNHTAGLKQHLSYFPDTDEQLPFQEIVEVINEEISLKSTPGTRYRYSNIGYIILGLIIEKVTGLSLEDAFQHYLFEPAKMEATGFFDYGSEVEGYRNSRYSLPQKNSYNQYIKVRGSGELRSTAEDLYRWDRVLTRGNILSEESKSFMFTPYLKSHGYGWKIKRSKVCGKIIYHEGGTEGFSSFFLRLPDYDAAVIVLSNVESHNPADKVARMCGKMLVTYLTRKQQISQ